MGELRYLSSLGDTKLIWNSDDKDEVEAAKETFDRLKKKGFMAFSVKKDGGKGKKITEFDAAAERIILTPGLQGG